MWRGQSQDQPQWRWAGLRAITQGQLQGRWAGGKEAYKTRSRKRIEECSKARANLNGGELVGRLKARANLNGGELDCEHTSQRDKRMATLKSLIWRGEAQSQGQPQWWRAGLGAIHQNINKEEGKGSQDTLQDQPLSAIWSGQPFLSLPLPFDFAFVSTFILALILAFDRGILSQYRGPGSAKCGRTGNYGRNIFCQEGITLAPCLWTWLEHCSPFPLIIQVNDFGWDNWTYRLRSSTRLHFRQGRVESRELCRSERGGIWRRNTWYLKELPRLVIQKVEWWVLISNGDSVKVRSSGCRSPWWWS